VICNYSRPQRLMVQLSQKIIMRRWEGVAMWNCGRSSKQRKVEKIWDLVHGGEKWKWEILYACGSPKVLETKKWINGPLKNYFDLVLDAWDHGWGENWGVMYCLLWWNTRTFGIWDFFLKKKKLGIKWFKISNVILWLIWENNQLIKYAMLIFVFDW
jgi:hypothetical protein